jgi:hypothetical protein
MEALGGSVSWSFQLQESAKFHGPLLSSSFHHQINLPLTLTLCFQKLLLLKPLVICTPMFTAALFTIAKLWKQPRCPTTDEWIKKMWYLYTMEFYLAMKKNEILSFRSKWI